MVVESLNCLRVFFFFFFLLFFSVPVSLRLQSGIPKMLVVSTLLLPFSVRVGGKFKEGTYEHLWLIHVDVWQKPTQFCKAIILQLKKKSLSV